MLKNSTTFRGSFREAIVSSVHPFASSIWTVLGSFLSTLRAKLIAPFPVACVPTGNSTRCPVIILYLTIASDTVYPRMWPTCK